MFSKTLDGLDWNGTRIARGDLVEELTRLRQEPGKPILVHGGAAFAQSLTRLGQIDEYHLVIHPVVLGSGLPLFPETETPLELDLVQASTFSSGAILTVYRRAPAAQER